MALSAQSPAPENVKLLTSRAVFLANILIVADDDKTWARASE
jgi:hypothetical protein